MIIKGVVDVKIVDYDVGGHQDHKDEDSGYGDGYADIYVYRVWIKCLSGLKI